MKKGILCLALCLTACSKESVVKEPKTTLGQAVFDDNIVSVELKMKEGLIEEITIDETFQDTTKKNLGYDYGMIAASSIRKEWFEQITYLEEKLKGTDGQLLLNEDGTAQDVDIKSGCTLPLEAIDQALEMAIRLQS